MQATLLPTPMIPYPTGSNPRSPGVHLSGLLRSMAVEYGFLDPKWVEDLKLVEVGGDGSLWWNALDPDSQIRMAAGLAWEQWYLPLVEGVTHQPGEMLVEGIYMTHDGQSLSTVMRQVGWKRSLRHTIACHEVKTTDKSINTVGDLNFFNPKNWLWLTQIACYCKGLETTLAFLHVLYWYGDYTRPFRKQLHIWRLEFTEEEIETIWSRVRDYRDEQAARGLITLT